MNAVSVENLTKIYPVPMRRQRVIAVKNLSPVSYTHLTLPTNREV